MSDLTRNTKPEKFGQCQLCARTTNLTFHHLIPRKMHRRKHFKKQYSKAELEQGITVCRSCHNAIHRFYSEMTLAKQFYSLERLQADPQLNAHVGWVRKQKLGC